MFTSTRPILGPGGAAFLGMRCTNIDGDTKHTGSLETGPEEEVARSNLVFRGTASPEFKDLLMMPDGIPDADAIAINLDERAVEFVPSDGEPCAFKAKVKVRVVSGEGSATIIIATKLNNDDDNPTLNELSLLHMRDGVLMLRPADKAQGDMFDGPAHLVPVLIIHAPGVPMRETQCQGDELSDEIGRVQFDMAEVKAGNKPSDVPAAPAKPKRRKAKGVVEDWGKGKDAAANQSDDD